MVADIIEVGTDWQNERKGFSTFSDGFPVKLMPLAGSLTYGTAYGGTASEEVLARDVDRNGAAYITGLTGSPGLPASGAFQPVLDGICFVGSTERKCYDALVAGFDSTGILAWASYYGGTGTSTPPTPIAVHCWGIIGSRCLLSCVHSAEDV